MGTNTLYFAYDAAGVPMSVNFNGTEYFYTSNIQGDVTGIVNAEGTTIVTYTYDAWGKLLNCTGSMASTLGTLNPLRYRGYVYDQETELYYLQSRYYDPEIGRFLNADGLITTGLGFAGNNMFAYCGNNPISRIDPKGKYWTIIILLIALYREIMYKHPDSLPYRSEEAAAQAFSEDVYNSSMYVRHEYGTSIYSTTVGGVKTYAYTPPKSGSPHGVGVGKGNIPAGADFVAYAHTHPTKNEFSPEDISIAHNGMFLVNAYVVGPNMILQKYDLLRGKIIEIGAIFPRELTANEKSQLIAQFSTSWDAHINGNDCGFDCREKQWPAP